MIQSFLSVSEYESISYLDGVNADTPCKGTKKLFSGKSVYIFLRLRVCIMVLSHIHQLRIKSFMVADY